MQRVASSTCGSTKASVGQASKQARHEPQWSAINTGSGSSFTSVSKADKKKIAAPFSRDQHGVLANPTETSLLSEFTFKQWC